MLPSLPLTSAVDNDQSLDDEMAERDRDAEESYFDTESPSTAAPMDNTDEDSVELPAQKTTHKWSAVLLFA